MVLPASAMGEGDGEYAESTYKNTKIRSTKVKSGGRMVIKRKGKKVSVRHIKRKRASARITNPDGSTIETRYTRSGRRIIIRRNRNGVIVRNVPNRSRPYAINHTDGIASIGIRPGLRLVISPFGISISN